jgi:hypothetical protein
VPTAAKSTAPKPTGPPKKNAGRSFGGNAGPDDDQEAARQEYRRQATRKNRQQERTHKLEERLETDERSEFDERQKSGRFLVRPPKLDAVHDGAGFLLGLFLYAMALNYIRGGAPATRGWLGAKFLNKPYTGELETLAPATPARPDTGGR